VAIPELGLLSRTRHADVEQPPLFFDFFGVAGSEIRWDAAIDHVQNVNASPFPGLGRMDRGQDRVILVEPRREETRRDYYLDVA
jgi:hypothetical protein